MSEKWRNLIAAAALTFLIVWNVLVAVTAVSPIANSQSFAIKSEGGTAVADFVHFYQCGFMTLSSDRHRVYDAGLQLAVTNQLISPLRIEQVFYNQYVPFLFPLLAPLATLPMSAAYTVWYSLSLLFFIAAVFMLFKGRTDLPRRDKALIAMGVLASIPAVICLKIGQTSFFLLAFFTLVYLGLRGGCDIGGGIGLSLMTIKPQYAPLLGIAAIARSRWRMIIVAVVAELLLLALAGFTIGWENVIGYPHILMHAETTVHFSGVNPQGMISLRGLLSHFFEAKGVLTASFIMLIPAAMAVFYLWRLARLGRLSHEWAMALLVVLCLAVSPHCHVYDLLLLTIPAVLTLPAAGFFKIAELKSVPFKIWSCLLLLYPLLTWVFYVPNLPWMFFIVNCALLISGSIYCLKPAIVRENG